MGGGGERTEVMNRDAGGVHIQLDDTIHCAVSSQGVSTRETATRRRAYKVTIGNSVSAVFSDGPVVNVTNI